MAATPAHQLHCNCGGGRVSVSPSRSVAVVTWSPPLAEVLTDILVRMNSSVLRGLWLIHSGSSILSFYHCSWGLIEGLPCLL